MSDKYTVRLVARNEGVEYRDQFDVYRFNVTRKEGRWIVFLPGSKTEHFMTHELSEEERARILPRVGNYLGSRKYFGFIGRSYPVSFEPEGPVSTVIAQNRRRVAEFLRKREGKN